MAATLEAIWPKMGAGYLKFLEQSEQLHSISDRFFFWRSIGSMRDTMDVKGAFDLKVLRDVMRMRLGKTVSGVIRENISDPNVAQMLDHFVQYVGSSPDASPAILCRHRPHADGGRHLVIRWAGLARCRWDWSSSALSLGLSFIPVKML